MPKSLARAPDMLREQLKKLSPETPGNGWWCDAVSWLQLIKAVVWQRGKVGFVHLEILFETIGQRAVVRDRIAVAMTERSLL